jgi:hypothetical protein
MTGKKILPTVCYINSKRLGSQSNTRSQIQAWGYKGRAFTYLHVGEEERESARGRSSILNRHLKLLGHRKLYGSPTDRWRVVVEDKIILRLPKQHRIGGARKLPEKNWPAGTNKKMPAFCRSSPCYQYPVCLWPEEFCQDMGFGCSRLEPVAYDLFSRCDWLLDSRQAHLAAI